LCDLTVFLKESGFKMAQDHAAIDAMFEKTAQLKRDQLTDWTA